MRGRRSSPVVPPRQRRGRRRGRGRLVLVLPHRAEGFVRVSPPSARRCRCRSSPRQQMVVTVLMLRRTTAKHAADADPATVSGGSGGGGILRRFLVLRGRHMTEKISRVHGRPEDAGARAPAPPAAGRRRSRQVARVEVAEDRGRRILAHVERLLPCFVVVAVGRGERGERANRSVNLFGFSCWMGPQVLRRHVATDGRVVISTPLGSAHESRAARLRPETVP